MNFSFKALKAVCAIAALSFVAASCSDDELVVEKTLTFEGSYFTNLIDNPQYGGKLLYGEPFEVESEWGSYLSYLGNDYSWFDADNTGLFSQTVEQYGSQVYWNGGDAISNYVSTDLSAGTSDNQLTVYGGGTSIETSKGGAGSSDNFCVHTGSCTAFSFKDGVERTVRSMQVNNTLYAVSVLTDGNYYCPAISEGEYFKVIAEGFNAAGVSTGKTEFTLAEGTSIVKNWTKWDLSCLGKVARIDLSFEANGNLTGEYGLNAPAYVAYDNVVVEYTL